MCILFFLRCVLSIHLLVCIFFHSSVIFCLSFLCGNLSISFSTLLKSPRIITFSFSSFSSILFFSSLKNSTFSFSLFGACITIMSSPLSSSSTSGRPLENSCIDFGFTFSVVVLFHLFRFRFIFYFSSLFLFFYFCFFILSLFSNCLLSRVFLFRTMFYLLYLSSHF